MEGVKESVFDFFYNREVGWGTSALFFITGLLCIFLLKRRARNRRR